MIKDYIDAYQDLCDKFENDLKNDDILQEYPSNVTRDFHSLKYYTDSLHICMSHLQETEETEQLKERCQKIWRHFEDLQKKYLLHYAQNCEIRKKISAKDDDVAFQNFCGSNLALKAALFDAKNCEQQGASIMTSLRNQRENILSSKASVSEIGNALTQSDSVVFRLSRWWRDII
ncbi:uncharacterized protein LOC128883641 [Hylaeus volcanicus]|uniref:uncharacterized protein LOC128883641 n=1 Tax=Hylaeus volcanicus TaxID=313075 RepID=UPI0023B83E9B|nr:uncharacterized protein LOC128883641 [Hylaeus volcanicus]